MSVPASKSLTNRFLLLAGLGRGPATVINPLRSRDSDLMLAGLEVLGASVERMPDTEGEETLRVSPSCGTPPMMAVRPRSTADSWHRHALPSGGGGSHGPGSALRR
ncbi:hypothetical protein [Nesterenkonia pannonica]|uniref:hypothetical protein n=1 Tax=Nesterenkonia pannonica TaxID=1548602 RepID=UPI0021649AA6|nr:hypothetical protein [Nesterenkonia pannonica]